MNTDRQQLFALMGEIFHNTRLILDAHFKSIQLSRPEWLVLAMLRLVPNSLSQAEARRYIGIEKSYFTKVLNQLEEKGYIVREIDAKNRRNRLIKRNPNAGKKLNQIFQFLNDFTNDIQADLTDKEVNQLFQVLFKIRSKIGEYKEDHNGKTITALP